MKILIATSHRGVVGGVQTYLRALLPKLRARGHELALLCEIPGRGAAIDDDCAGVTLVATGDLAALRSDVCLIHGLRDPELEAYLVHRFPSLLYAHDYHGACISGSKRHGFPNPTPCARRFGTGCLALHHLRRCGGLNPLTTLGDYRLQRRRAALLSDYRSVLVASTHMRDEYRRAGVRPEQIGVVPLFPAGCEPDPEPPEPRDFSNRVLMVGRLTEVKGGRWLPPAVRRAADRLGRRLTLVLAGDGPERSAIERVAAKVDVPLEAVGWVESRQRMELMRAADVLAVASTWPEPFGLVGVEAACVGLPAAAFAVGGITDWLTPGRSGELAPADPPTVAGLAEALVRALRSAEHWQTLRTGAWRRALWFSADQHVDTLERELLEATVPAQAVRCGALPSPGSPPPRWSRGPQEWRS